MQTPPTRSICQVTVYVDDNCASRDVGAWIWNGTDQQVPESFQRDQTVLRAKNEGRTGTEQPEPIGKKKLPDQRLRKRVGLCIRKVTGGPTIGINQHAGIAEPVKELQRGMRRAPACVPVFKDAVGFSVANSLRFQRDRAAKRNQRRNVTPRGRTTEAAITGF